MEHPKYHGFFSVPDSPGVFYNQKFGKIIKDPSFAKLNENSITAFDLLETKPPNTYEEAKIATTDHRYRVTGETNKIRQLIGANGETPIMKYIYQDGSDKFGWVVEKKH